MPTPAAPSVVDRELPTDEARALLELTRDLVMKEMLPRVDKAEDSGDFPRDVFSVLGQAGLLSLPYPEEFGGGGQPATVYLQVVEELAGGWLAVGLGVSVHVLACHGVANFGTREQQQRLLPAMLGGETLGAFCLSEPHAGSDVAAQRTRAVRSESGDRYTVTGDKAWITHGPVADFFLLMARTDDGHQGVSAFHLSGHSRQLYLYAARCKDEGKPYSMQAAMAKLVATDTCMKVTTDMVQVLGAAGYVQDYPVERYMREAKVLQIVEGANQVQRMVISRTLTGATVGSWSDGPRGGAGAGRTDQQ